MNPTFKISPRPPTNLASGAYFLFARFVGGRGGSVTCGRAVLGMFVGNWRVGLNSTFFQKSGGGGLNFAFFLKKNFKFIHLLEKGEI